MTEKNYNPEQKMIKSTKKQNVAVAKKEEKVNVPVKEEKTDSKKEVKPVVKKVKKEFACTNPINVPVSTKKAMAVCRFIKNKTIDHAIKDLEQVMAQKKAVPMKGEIPHRHGNIMAGRYPVRTAKEFILILKGLKGNSTMNGIENPVISEAVANWASRPYGRFGATKKKRTHLRIVAREKKEAKK